MIKINADHKTVRELIKKDNKLEIKVKSAILRTACKTIANQTLDEKVLKQIKKHVNDGIVESFGTITGSYSTQRFVPSHKFQGHINSAISKAQDEIISVEMQKFRVTIQEKINEKLKYLESYIDDCFSDQTLLNMSNKIADQKIKHLVDSFKATP